MDRRSTELRFKPWGKSGNTIARAIVSILFFPLVLDAQDVACQVFVISGKVRVKGKDRDVFIETKGDVSSGEEVALTTKGTIAYLNIGVRVERLDPLELRRVDCKQNAATSDPITQRLSRLMERVMNKGTAPSPPLGYKGQPDKRNCAKLRVLFPQGGTKVLETRPVFAWNLSSAIFEVTLLLDEDQKVQWRRIVSGVGTLAYPSERQPLEPGKAYSWDIKSLEGISQDDSATFRVATEADRRDVNEETQKIHLACEEHHLSEENCSLAIAGFYSERGFLYDAVQVLLKEQTHGATGKLIAPLLYRLLQIQAEPSE